MPDDMVDMDDLKRYAEEHDALRKQVMDENPGMPFVTAVVVASDRASKKFASEQLAKGAMTFNEALVHVGSYSRMEWMVEEYERGLVTINELLDATIENWSVSDPDDTDPRFLDLWKWAWVRNGERYVRDGKALPRSSKLVVYRGEDYLAKDKRGIAWTTDIKIAERFAKGAALRAPVEGGKIYMGRIDRRKVLAYLTDRGESEVICDPADVEDFG